MGARTCSLRVNVELLLLEVGRNALHDFLSFGRVVDLQGVKVLGCAQLELGNCGLLVFLDLLCLYLLVLPPTMECGLAVDPENGIELDNELDDEFAEYPPRILLDLLFFPP